MVKLRAMVQRNSILLTLAVLLHCATAGSAAVLNYQGRVSIDGMNFNGQGYFVFSIHDTNGAIL